MSPIVDELIKVFEEAKPLHHSDTKYTVSKTISTLAVLYEKARNAVEFRAEHLVRRAAIERILKRRILLNGGTASIADNLIVELLWAKYVDSSLVDDAKVKEIHSVVERYIQLKHSSFHNAGSHSGVRWDTILGLASTEIEEIIVSAKKREALVHFFYQAIRSDIRLPDADEKYVNMQTYIAVERAFAQSDDATLSYHLLKMIQPTWVSADHPKTQEEVELFFHNVHLIHKSLSDPEGEQLYRYVRKRTPPFLLIRDFFLQEGEHARAIIDDHTKFEHTLAEICAKRYHEIGNKVRRAVFRSFVYIFLTKMVFAFALEAPFDIFIAKKLSYVPLAINMLFPPVLLFFVAGLISVPGSDNTRKLIDSVMTIVHNFDSLKHDTDIYVSKPQVKRPILTAIFSIFYLATFLLSFGFISFVLTKLQFNIASQIIFVFFITLVSFFAYRIRQSAKEYEVIDRQGFLGPFVDFFFLPVLRVGHLLSREIARLNVLIFFFDFILEAPLKVIFEVFEEWIRFIRTKKDEIV